VVLLTRFWMRMLLLMLGLMGVLMRFSWQLGRVIWRILRFVSLVSRWVLHSWGKVCEQFRAFFCCDSVDSDFVVFGVSGVGIGSDITLVVWLDE
jgi:hypothetical protein